MAQHFDARDQESPQDSGWGEWINRLNAALRWGQRWTAGLRLDPLRDVLAPPARQPQLRRSARLDAGARLPKDNESRYKTYDLTRPRCG